MRVDARTAVLLWPISSGLLYGIIIMIAVVAAHLAHSRMHKVENKLACIHSKPVI